MNCSLDKVIYQLSTTECLNRLKHPTLPTIAILAVGSASYENFLLSDETSDVDLMVVVESDTPLYSSGERFYVGDRSVSSFFVSSTTLFSENPGLPFLHRNLFYLIYLSPMDSPLYCTDAFTSLWDEHRDRWEDIRNRALFTYLRRNKQVLLHLYSGTFSLDMITKKIFYLMYIYYRLKGITDFDSSQLMRIKRGKYSLLSEDDKTFIRKVAEQLLLYLHDGNTSR